MSADRQLPLETVIVVKRRDDLTEHATNELSGESRFPRSTFLGGERFLLMTFSSRPLGRTFGCAGGSVASYESARNGRPNSLRRGFGLACLGWSFSASAREEAVAEPATTESPTPVATPAEAVHAGLTVTQIPVAMRARQSGRPSQNPFGSTAYLLRSVFALTLALLRGSLRKRPRA